MSSEGRAHWDRRLVPTVELAMNSTPSSVSGFRPLDLVFVSHPDVCHAVFDDDDHLGVSSFAERLAAAEERLSDARLAIVRARAEQQRRYGRRRAAPVKMVAGDEVFVRLTDRPIPGLRVDKLDPRKAGPYRVQEILLPHRVRLELPADVGVGDEFSVEQLDLVPREPDPFFADRAALPVPPVDPPVLHGDAPVDDGDGSADLEAHPRLPEDGDSVAEVPSNRPARHRQLPPNLRGFDLGTVRSSSSSALADALRGPIFTSRTVDVDGVSVELRERPIAFLSRLTSVAEKKMVASELELCCLAWAFARFAHLLEGAEVTVVTDHAPLGAMLLSTAEIPYGPTISRCRALLMPHLPNLRFIHRPGHRHTNADALSRLPLPPS
ncbi:hypothetical protein A4X06_0g7025 [Tilletia controversa]|uniref:Reverse transcriptase RNase H-like domain-containing protein n=1 Tax=Tilletia controversa TaxID=13291 RepID=A0A8X7MNL1_9BASI|nr:hypothetical protein A4X06_0g7025 [Tilletia controversa]